MAEYAPNAADESLVAFTTNEAFLDLTQQDARLAGMEFASLCQGYLDIRTPSRGVQPTKYAEHDRLWDDGSQTRVRVLSRFGDPQLDRRSKEMGISDDPYEISLRSWMGPGSPDAHRMVNVIYSHNRQTGYVYKEIHRPTLIIERILEAKLRATLQGIDPGATEEAIVEDLRNDGRTLKEMGIDMRTVVGGAEIAALGRLIWQH
ncbi:MAG TPA: hypothetical protein VLF43_00580 [Candidatus Saccharimonadales bacterium]|nr:hypothetical protein [Candidatus Saccharimonadales bacterium]